MYKSGHQSITRAYLKNVGRNTRKNVVWTGFFYKTLNFIESEKGHKKWWCHHENYEELGNIFLQVSSFLHLIAIAYGSKKLHLQHSSRLR